MNTRFHYYPALLLLLLFVGYSTGSYAEGLHSTNKPLTTDERWAIKRQVMSKPGVMLDMANMTDNGYAWQNDVLWQGEALPANEKWFTAGFFFNRAGYKGVWLQYTFQLDETSGSLTKFKRSYGTGTFR